MHKTTAVEEGNSHGKHAVIRTPATTTTTETKKQFRWENCNGKLRFHTKLCVFCKKKTNFSQPKIPLDLWPISISNQDLLAYWPGRKFATKPHGIRWTQKKATTHEEINHLARCRMINRKVLQSTFNSFKWYKSISMANRAHVFSFAAFFSNLFCRWVFIFSIADDYLDISIVVVVLDVHGVKHTGKRRRVIVYRQPQCFLNRFLEITRIKY